MDTGNNLREETRFNWLKLTLKLVVTGGCTWYISGKIDVEQAGAVLAKTEWVNLLPAIGLFILSKLVSAKRLQVYFNTIQVPLTTRENIQLYWLGMFYNLFLPGAISGDIYKIILLSKKYKTPVKKLTAAVVLDRISGLLGLGLLLAAFSFEVAIPAVYPVFISTAAILAILLFYFFLQKFFTGFLKGFTSTLLLGIAVQAIQLISVYLIMRSLGVESGKTAYLFLFLISSAVSVLPLTIGGLGIRELVFLHGSDLLQAGAAEAAVLISLLFYLLTLVTSVWGAAWLFKSPLNEKGPSDEPLIS